MFLFKGVFRVNSTMIHGVQYVTFSFYDGDKDLFQKVGDLISDSFQASEPDEIPNEILLDSGIASEKEQRYCVLRKGATIWQQKQLRFIAGSARMTAA